MTSKLWAEAKGENNAQRAISILTTVSSYFYRLYGSKDDVAAYLWSHQKAMGRRGWFFSISYSERAVLDASKWYKEKAKQLSQLQSEERFYRSLIGMPGLIFEDGIAKGEDLTATATREMPRDRHEPEKAGMSTQLEAPRSTGLQRRSAAAALRSMAADAKDPQQQAQILRGASQLEQSLAEDVLGSDLESLKVEHAKELEPLADLAAEDKLASGFKTWFDLYLRKPQTAKQQAIRFYDAFENRLDAHDPELLERFMKLQDELESP
ncbi:MAG: hypothetical protein WBX25_29840 [Rhodomicrobium sp.]